MYIYKQLLTNYTFVEERGVKWGTFLELSVCREPNEESNETH